MIVEVAEFFIDPNDGKAFGEALTNAATAVLSKAQGYRSHRILSGIEAPERVVLLVEWDTLQAHTEGFRNSSAFAEWRAIIGPFFAEPPRVQHFNVLG